MAALLLLGGNTANATVLISNAGTFTESPGVVDWFYNVALAPDQVLRPGDFFTIYDVPNIANVPNSVFFAPNSGSFLKTIAGTTPPNPAGAGAGDDPLINNINFTYDPTSSTTITGGTGQIILGTLTIKSTTNIPLQTDYAAQAHLKPFPNPPSTSTGFVDVATAAVPEPSSVTLMALGLIAFGVVAMRRRNV